MVPFGVRAEEADEAKSCYQYMTRESRGTNEDGKKIERVQFK